MKYIISQEIFEKYPGTMLGVVVAKKINNENSEEVKKLLLEEHANIRSKFKTEELTKLPKIACWREVYKKFGEKPKKYQASIENMYRTILKGESVRSINKIVDLYNYISLKHTVSAGGEDLDKAEGDVTLKFAAGSEKFRALNSEEITNPKTGEVIYVDDKEVLCRRWNWRQCDKTKIEESSKNVALFLETVPPFTKEEVESITNELAEMVKKYCGGEVSTGIVDEENPEFEII